MLNINPNRTKKNRFSNFVYQSEVNSSNEFRATSFVESLRDNNRTQIAFGSTTTIDVRSSKKIEYLRECSTQTIDQSKTAENVSQKVFNSNKCRGVNPIKNNKTVDDKMTKNHCEGDTETEYEPLMTQEGLASLPFDRSFNVVNFLKQGDSGENIQFKQNLNISKLLLSGSALTKAYLERNLNKLKRSATEVKPNVQLPQHAPKNRRTIPRSQSFVEHTRHSSVKEGPNAKHLPNISIHSDRPKNCYVKVNEVTQTELRSKRFSFMSPTIASECKNQSLEIKHIENLISPTRNTRNVKSISPRPRYTRAAPSKCHYSENNDVYSFDPESDVKFDEKNSSGELESRGTSTASSETALLQGINKLRDPDWNTSLRGLAEIVEVCKVLDTEFIFPHMTQINQRIIDLIKSPRSHVSRTSCQAVGHLFEYVKDTRRPEFDELVDSLLCKCADANKFIRHDANLALDCMVTHIPTFHAVRAICAKAPEHKNPLVRIAAARILVCAIVLAGPQSIIHPQSNEYTRRRIILKMAAFLEDRNSDVRKYGERIYKMFTKERIFELYLNRYLEKDVIHKMKKGYERQ